jgi:hypothetical protein
MVDMQVVPRLAFLQPISAIDLNEEPMITGPGRPPAGCGGCNDRASVGRRQALRAGDLADGVPSRSGAQT